MKKLISILLGMVVIAGCGKVAFVSNQATHGDRQAVLHAEHPGAFLAPDRFKIKDIVTEESFGGAEAALRATFSLLDSHGRTLRPDDLRITHEKKVHLIVVRDDLRDWHHVHPTFVNDLWEVRLPLLQGDYNFYADITPNNDAAAVLRQYVSRGSNPSSTLGRPTPLEKQLVIQKPYQVELRASPQVGETPLTFVVTKNSQPVSTISPYLGAYGHVVLLGHDSPDSFYHVHPTTVEQPANGQVSFVTTFPQPGRYTAFAQFNVDGEVRTFPFTFDVH